MQISGAATRSFVQSAASKGGRASPGRFCGTEPRMPTPRASSLKLQTAAMVTTMAMAGPIFARKSAGRSPSPMRSSRGLRPLRTQKRNASEARPIAAV